MEATGRTVLCACSAFCLLFILTEVSSELIHIDPSVRHVTEGDSVFLSVKTNFSPDKAEFQGTWCHTGMSVTKPRILVTFTKKNTILNMKHRDHLVFNNSTFSLEIKNLNRKDEGDYHLSITIKHDNKPGDIEEEKTIRVTVDVPVSNPAIEKSPSYAVIEDKANVTWTCSVENGTRVMFKWFRNNVALGPSDRYHYSQDNSTLLISPVRKEDKGSYHCVASNPVTRGQHSRAVELNVYYGPYNLEVNSVQGLRTGEVFTINPGELVFFECQADSNPPNSYVWISKTRNATQIVTEGPRLEVRSYRLAQAEEYLCRAFNNVTQKQDEAQFTLVVASLGTGKEKHIQEGNSVSPLAVITVCSFFVIGLMLLFFLRRTCHPKRVLMSIYNKPFSEQKRPHRSGHEDATEDFGIYEFVSIPGKTESAQASCRSLARLESIQDMHTTIYDVIRHVPETPSHSLLK
ncbi:HEPACAM family member 2 [Pelmatolapia mariae]|uniref:HEPACAM family member 2 n=1 Tax=Pelmatolapia mariae TaxID=158779 RepID=UPI003211EB9D